MRFASLGSGSLGNATLVEVSEVGYQQVIMIDCGFSVKETKKRLARLGYLPTDLSAVLLTHEHTDHVGSALAFCKKFKIKLIMSWGTAMATQVFNASLDSINDVMIVESGKKFELGALCVYPFTVPHDAREPLQYVFSDGLHKLGMLTDVGHITPHIELILKNCHALILECNYDSSMLERGSYHETLKARIAGDYGHLSNLQAVNLLHKIFHRNLQHVIAAHLSSENNSPHHVRCALSTVLNVKPDDILFANQDQGIDWLSLRSN